MKLKAAKITNKTDAPTNTEVTTNIDTPANTTALKDIDTETETSTKTSTVTISTTAPGDTEPPTESEIITNTKTDNNTITTKTHITTQTEVIADQGITVADIMSPNVIFTNAGTPILEAAKIMQINNINAIPVGSESGVYGIITDRDIALRVVAQGKDPSSTLVGDIMSKEVYSCLMSDSVTTAADTMKAHNVSRLVVENNEGKIVGTVSSLCGRKSGCIQRRFNDDEALNITPGDKA
jgi:CBS domain-containing protein